MEIPLFAVSNVWHALWSYPWRYILTTWNYSPDKIKIIVIWREPNKPLFYMSQRIALTEVDCRVLLLLVHHLGSVPHIAAYICLELI